MATPKKARRGPAYWRGVNYIAWNDEPSDMDIDEIEGYISTQAVSETTGISARKVAEDVVKLRDRGFDHLRMVAS